MIFASDLDRTLIYSVKFTEGMNPLDLVEAETKDGKVISYMSRKGFEILQGISRHITFIPVTTRTIDQYKRISILEDIPHKYAITSNGGNILEDGKIDGQWSEIVQKKLESGSIPLQEALALFQKSCPSSWLKKTRIADGLFFYAIVDTQMFAIEELSELREKLERCGWSMTRNSSKLYCIPKCINKGDALMHIAGKHGDKGIISCGDSALDIEMAEVSQCFISPLNAQIYTGMRDVANRLSIRFTGREGIPAAEEILQEVEKIVLQNTKK